MVASAHSGTARPPVSPARGRWMPQPKAASGEQVMAPTSNSTASRSTIMLAAKRTFSSRQSLPIWQLISVQS